MDSLVKLASADIVLNYVNGQCMTLSIEGPLADATMQLTTQPSQYELPLTQTEDGKRAQPIVDEELTTMSLRIPGIRNYTMTFSDDEDAKKAMQEAWDALKVEWKNLFSDDLVSVLKEIHEAQKNEKKNGGAA
jgi:hypothetical protein